MRPPPVEKIPSIREFFEPCGEVSLQRLGSLKNESKPQMGFITISYGMSHRAERARLPLLLVMGHGHIVVNKALMNLCLSLCRPALGLSGWMDG